MGLSKYKLGELLIRNTETNAESAFGIENVRGLLNTKEISGTKVNVADRDLTKFLVVRPGGFVFNHRVHDKLGLGYNTSEETYLFTNDYVAFYVKPELNGTILFPDYLYIWYLRPEFDRYMLFKTYGSATLFFSWDNMCELEIQLPDISVQQKYVNVYNAMLANQKSYERGLEDLKLVCDAYIENLRYELPCKAIGQYINQKNKRNIDKTISRVMGLSTQKEFRDAQSRVNRNELGNYKIVEFGDFVFVPTTDTWKVLAFSFNSSNQPLVVSPIYEVFSVDRNYILPEYLAMWLSRAEFDRYARFHSWGSARENFSFFDMCNVRIPIPDIHIQKSISDIYLVYKQRNSINKTLKSQIKNICPILIKGSIEEAQKTDEA